MSTRLFDFWKVIISKTMDQLIPIASKLQDVLGAVGQTTQLDLPQIVVVRTTLLATVDATGTRMI